MAAGTIKKLSSDQALLAMNGHPFTRRDIDSAIFIDIAQNIDEIPNLHMDRIHCRYRIIDTLNRLLLYEEAYGLVESSVLDFSCTSGAIDRNSEYKFIEGPPNHCQHYCLRYAKVLTVCRNHDHLSIEGQYIDVAEHKDKLFIKWDRRYDGVNLCGSSVRIIPDNTITSRGHRGLDILRNAFGIVNDDYCKGNIGIVKAMFDFIHTNPSVSSNVSPIEYPSEEMNANPFWGRALVKASAARAILRAKRPFIIRTSVPWLQNEINWLERLVERLRRTHEAKIGILCPRWSQHKRKIESRFKNDNSVAVFISRPVISNSNLDYLLIFQAHLIGVTEAIEWMTEVKEDGCVMLIGDPLMPNVRVHNPQVRNACASVLNWFYDRSRYPEYFEDSPQNPYIAHCRLYERHEYNPFIFDYFSRTFYNEPSGIHPGRSGVDFELFNGLAIMDGCSPYNQHEVDRCLAKIEELVTRSNVDQCSIGVLTTYCAQKRKIIEKCTRLSFDEVFVGLPEDFEDTVRDYLIISTVETAERIADGERHLFSDLLYDKLFLNLALTRGRKEILVLGDPDVIGSIKHWSELRTSRGPPEDISVDQSQDSCVVV